MTVCLLSGASSYEADRLLATIEHALNTHRETGRIVIAHSGDGMSLTVAEQEQLDVDLWDNVKFLAWDDLVFPPQESPTT